MPIVYRSSLGRPLTYAEMDGNFADLAGRTDVAWAMDGVEPSIREGIGTPAELLPFMGGISAYAYSPALPSESFANWDVPFEWKTGTDLYLAFHWSPGSSTATGTVRWGVEYTGAFVNGTFFAPITEYYNSPHPTSHPYMHHQEISTPFPGDQVEPNMRFLLRIFRDSADPADTFPDDAFLVGLDFYYQVDKFGLQSFLPPYP